MSEKQKKALFLHGSDEWSTPDDFFNKLNDEFHFTLDVCATDENHKCDHYFTKEDDGLQKDWGGNIVWCNPPYSKIKDWVKKAYYEGKKDNTIVVLLIPSRTETRYFHDYILNRCELRFVKGRIHFNNSYYGAPFPSVVCIFRGAKM